MTAHEVEQTIDIAKLLILAEQDIRRIKTSRILEYEYPISMLSHLKHVWNINVALCNLKDPIFKD